MSFFKLSTVFLDMSRDLFISLAQDNTLDNLINLGNKINIFFDNVKNSKSVNGTEKAFISSLKFDSAQENLEDFEMTISEPESKIDIRAVNEFAAGTIDILNDFLSKNTKAKEVLQTFFEKLSTIDPEISYEGNLYDDIINFANITKSFIINNFKKFTGDKELIEDDILNMAKEFEIYKMEIKDKGRQDFSLSGAKDKEAYQAQLNRLIEMRRLDPGGYKNFVEARKKYAREWMAKKLEEDPDFKAKQRKLQKKWREKHSLKNLKELEKALTTEKDLEAREELISNIEAIKKRLKKNELRNVQEANRIRDLKNSGTLEGDVKKYTEDVASFKKNMSDKVINANYKQWIENITELKDFRDSLAKNFEIIKIDNIKSERAKKAKEENIEIVKSIMAYFRNGGNALEPLKSSKEYNHFEEFSKLNTSFINTIRKNNFYPKPHIKKQLLTSATLLLHFIPKMVTSSKSGYKNSPIKSLIEDLNLIISKHLEANEFDIEHDIEDEYDF